MTRNCSSRVAVSLIYRWAQTSKSEFVATTGKVLIQSQVWRDGASISPRVRTLYARSHTRQAMGHWAQRPLACRARHEMEVNATPAMDTYSRKVLTSARRKIAKDHMEASEFPITLTTFPRLGAKDRSLVPEYPLSGDKLRSQFLPDQIANPHIRFPTLAANIRARRGRKVEINVPVFKDEKTTWPFNDPTVDYDLHNWPEDDDVRNGAAKENHIYMDAMAFGMGSCCLQITFQAKNIEEGRKMYDQLSPLGPILLALTAATPIYKGFLADTDVRWNQISRAVDDRTPEELGEKVRLVQCPVTTCN